MSVIEMTCAIVAWLAPMPFITNGAPVTRPIEIVWATANAIAKRCIERDDARACDWSRPAAWLDVWGAFETGYQDIGGACPNTEPGTPCSKKHAVTCGPWMTDCNRKRDPGLEGEAVLALDMMFESVDACGKLARQKGDEVIAFGLYAGGACEAYGVVRFRLRWVAKELGQ